VSPHSADVHDLIRVHGARVNNLKDIAVEIPKRRLTVFTGVSGSGKSSLVFDTIAATTVAGSCSRAPPLIWWPPARRSPASTWLSTSGAERCWG
jgi:hypothetical protein